MPRSTTKLLLFAALCLSGVEGRIFNDHGDPEDDDGATDNGGGIVVDGQVFFSGGPDDDLTGGSSSSNSDSILGGGSDQNWGVGGLTSLQLQIGNSTIMATSGKDLCSDSWFIFDFCLKNECPYHDYLCPTFGQSLINLDTCSDMTEGFCSQTNEATCCVDKCLGQFAKVTECMQGRISSEPLGVCGGPMDCGVLYGNSTNSTSEEVIDPNSPLIFIDGEEGLSVFDSFQFGPYGAVEMQERCPEQWTSFVGCVSMQCPYNFVEVCEVTNENQGLAAPVGIMKAGLFDLTCQDLQQDICDFAGGEACCLRSCLAETQQMTACIHQTKSFTDLTTCKQVDACNLLSGSLSQSRQAPDDAASSGVSRGLVFGLLTIAAVLLA